MTAVARVAPSRQLHPPSEAQRLWVRPALVLALVVAAYHQSLRSLLEGLQLDTPIAHLALVPVIALLLAFVKRRPGFEPNIHDRQLDWIVGLPLVVGALIMNFVLPTHLSTDYWVYRIDLLSLPLFVAGAITLVFGLRTLWRLRASVLFLFLAWPWPYNQVLDRWLGRFTDFTIDGLRLALHAMPLAKPVVGSDGSLFEVMHQATAVRMSVASACSGANGLVGFFLVGLAFLQVIEGDRWRKFAWLATGGFLVWLFNVGRILIIFAAAKSWGEKVAIEGFHPYVGLVVFNVAIVCMLFLLRPFGLSLGGAARSAPVNRSPYRPQGRLALSVTLVVGLALTGLNADLRQLDNVANSLGSPRLVSFAQNRETPDGWQLNESARIDWARRFFGSDSNWIRYIYSSTGSGQMTSNLPIFADVIDTSSRSALSAYGVEACYKFHGYRIAGKHSVDLGNGVIGGVLTWTNTDSNTTWTSLYWHWPIKSAKGTRYERVTLLIADNAGGQVAAPELRDDLTKRVQLDVSNALRGGGGSGVSARIAQTQDFLAAFGRDLVSRRIASPDH